MDSVIDRNMLAGALRVSLDQLTEAERVVLAALTSFVTLGAKTQSVIDTPTTFVADYQDNSTATRVEVPIVSIVGIGNTLADAMHAFVVAVVQAKGNELPVEVRWRRTIQVAQERDVDRDELVFRISARCAFVNQSHIKQAEAA